MTKSKNDQFFGHHLITDDSGKYMRRLWIGRLRLHIFYRGDNDPDPHDHPWDFWTFPLTSYVEEVTGRAWHEKPEDWPENKTPADFHYIQPEIVPAFRLSFRHATHCHRVLGRAGKWKSEITDLTYPVVVPGRIITIVWRSKPKRAWGFLKQRDGRWCWVAWRDYVYGGGKRGPCE